MAIFNMNAIWHLKLNSNLGVFVSGGECSFKFSHIEQILRYSILCMLMTLMLTSDVYDAGF